MYSIYLRFHSDATREMEAQTRTGDPAQALAAFRTLLGRRDLDGERAGVVLRDQLRGRTLLFSRFDLPEQQLLPGDPIGDLTQLLGDADGDTRAIVAARPAAAPAPDDGFAALVKRWRQRQGWTLREAAARLDVPYDTLAGWESGKPAGNAGKLGRALLLQLEGAAG